MLECGSLVFSHARTSPSQLASLCSLALQVAARASSLVSVFCWSCTDAVQAAVHFAAYTPVQGETETLPNAGRLFLIVRIQPCNHTMEGVLLYVLFRGVSLGDNGPVEPNALASLNILYAHEKGEKKQNKTRSRVSLSYGGTGKERYSQWLSS